MNKTARLKKLSRHLLATTCLSAAAVGAAYGTTITESPEPGEFGHTLGASTVLSTIAPLTIPGTNTVNGETNGDNLDAYFTFDLGSGEANTSFSYSFSITSSSNQGGHFEILNDSGTNIGSTTEFAFGSNLGAGLVTSGTGTVPGNGDIVAAVLQGNEAGSISFTVTVTDTTPVAPEPGTFAELGLGLAGAVALRRRFKTHKA